MGISELREQALVAASEVMTSGLHSVGLLPDAPSSASEAYRSSYADGRMAAARWYVLRQNLRCTLIERGDTESSQGFHDGFVAGMKALAEAK